MQKLLAALLLAIALLTAGHLTFEIPDHGMKFDLTQDGDTISGKVVRNRDGETRTATLNLKRQP